MSANNLPIIPFPRCPHCNSEMPEVGRFNWRAPGSQILAVYCPNEECRKILHMQIVLAVQPVEDEASSRLHIPH